MGVNVYSSLGEIIPGYRYTPATPNHVSKYGVLKQMMERIWIPRLGALGAGFLLVTGIGAAEPTVFTPPPREIRIKTPEDIEQGKENVKAVAQQLEELFREIPAPKTVKTELIPPYYKIIKMPPSRNAETAGERATLIYQCRYNTAEKLLNAVDAMVINGMSEEAEERNMLIVTDSAANVEAIKDALIAMDVPSPQVLIEARVVEVLVGDGMERNLSATFNHVSTGIDAEGNDTPVNSSAGFNTSVLGQSTQDIGGTMNWTFGSKDNNVKVSFQWLLNASDARILSAPNLFLTCNELAQISTGQDTPIQELSNNGSNTTTSTTFKRVGVTLKVTPQMINRDSAVLKIEPEVSNIQSYQRIVQAGGYYDVPVISIRNMSTILKIADGQVVAMGGLYSNTESMTQERIPFLSDLPYLGELFTSKSYTKEITQLIFFLRVRILQPDEVPEGLMFDPNLVIEESDQLGEIIRNSSALPKLPETTLEQVEQEFIREPQEREGRNTLPLTPAPEDAEK